MTKQGKRPGMGIYLAAMLLLLAAYYVFYGSIRTPGVTYAQVGDLFRLEQVDSFIIRDGDELYLTLKDGTVVHNELGSVYLFWQDYGQLIRDQKDRAVLKDYDSKPVYTPP